MKQVAQIREYCAKVQKEALDRVRARLTYLEWPAERDAYALLNDNYLDHLTELTNTMMRQMGVSEGNPSEERFDKGRRAAVAAAGRGPRGV